MSNLDVSKIDLCKFETSDGVLLEGCAEYIEEVKVDYSGLAIAAVITITFVIIVVFIWKKFALATKVKENSKTIAAFLSGVSIWCFSIYAYSELYQVDINFWVWCTYPPLIVLAIYVWFRVFVFRKKL